MSFSKSFNKFPRALILAGGLALMASASPIALSAHAQNFWTGSVSGDWTDGANWSLSSPPDFATDVMISGSTPNNPNFILSDVAYQLNSLVVGSAGVGDGRGSLVIEDVRVGSSSILDITNRLAIGDGGNANGLLTVNGAKLSAQHFDASMTIGTAGGTGTVIFNYDTARDTEGHLDGDTLIIGDGAGSNGTLIFNDSSFYLYNSSIPQQIGIRIGVNGGTGTLTLNSTDPNSGYRSYISVSEAFVVLGDGAGSQATININNGSSFQVQTGNYGPDDHITLSAGINSGRAEINITGSNDLYYGNNHLVSANFLLGDTGGTGILNLIETANVDIRQYIYFGRGAGSQALVNINGGSLISVAYYGSSFESISAVGVNGGIAEINIAGISPNGRESSMSIEGGVNLGMGTGGVGSINILGTGKLTTLTGYPGAFSEQRFVRLGVDGGTGNVNVSGTNSVWYIGGDANGQYQYDPINFPAADLYIGYSGVGNVTVANGGKISVGWAKRDYYINENTGANYFTIVNSGGVGTVYLADQAGSQGSLTIGGAPGTEAQGSGILLAQQIQFGAGNGSLNFNITDTDFQFAIPVAGQGTIGNYAGTTWLTADNSGFSGATDLYGGTLGLHSDVAIGSSLVSVKADAALAYNNGVAIANAIDITGSSTLSVTVRENVLPTAVAAFAVVGNVATQNAVISGTGNLAKIEEGTLILTAENTYTGSTAINGGVLALSGQGSIAQSSVVEANTVFDISAVTTGASSIRSLAGTGAVLLGDNDLVLTAAAHTFSGSITGNGGLRVTGGTETLSGANSYLGDTVISNATLRAGATNTLSAASNVFVNAGGTLDLNGYDQTIPSVTNSGTISDSGGLGTVLTVSGNYIGNGGVLSLNTMLGGNDSLTDKLIVNGTTSGTTSVRVNNVNGAGAQTTGSGIQIIQVKGAGSTGLFTQAGRIAAGAYEYTLYQNGVDADANDGNWYLRSEAKSGSDYRVEVPLAAAIMPIAMEYGYTMVGTLHERTSAIGFNAPKPLYTERVVRDRFGKKQMVRTPVEASTNNAQSWFGGAWGRLIGQRGFEDRGENFLKNGPNYNYTFGGLQAGLDVYGRETAESSDKAGIYVGYGDITADVKGAYGDKAGSINMDAYSVGAYWTHRSAQGWYTDSVLQGTWYSTDATSSAGQKIKPDGFGFLASLEGGYKVTMANGLSIEPQAQLAYQALSFDNVSDAYGQFRFSDSDSFRGRVGVLVSKTWDTGSLAAPRPVTLWGRVNIWHEFSGDTEMTATSLNGTNPVVVPSSLGGTWVQLGTGVSAQVSSNISVFATGDYSHSLDNKGREAWSGKLGTTIRW